jgi:hypothetical protein
MKIPEKIAASLQHALYLSTLDDCCPDEFLGGRPAVKPNNANELWGNCVELIYRCFVCDLLKVSMGWNKTDDPMDLVKALAQHDPFDSDDFNEYGAEYWIAPHFYATEKSKILLSKYKIGDLSQSVCVEFMGEIEDMFEEYKIPWGSNFIFT